MQQFFNDLGHWLVNMPVWEQMLMVFVISMIPIIELRGGIIVAAICGLPWYLAFPAAVIGNALPAPFIVVYIRRIFKWLKRKNRLVGAVYRLEQRAEKRINKLPNAVLVGLAIFVAVPLPGTGAWTGSLLAGVMNLRLRRAFPAILIGVITAGFVMCILSYGLFGVVASAL